MLNKIEKRYDVVMTSAGYPVFHQRGYFDDVWSLIGPTNRSMMPTITVGHYRFEKGDWDRFGREVIRKNVRWEVLR